MLLVILFGATPSAQSAASRHDPLSNSIVIGESNPTKLAPKSPVAAFGEALFFDTALSADGRVACASCHRPSEGFADPSPVSSGIRGLKGTRNAPGLVDVSRRASFFWDGRRTPLMQAATVAFFDTREQGLDSEATLLRLIGKNHASALTTQLGIMPSALRMDHVAAAMVAYLETLGSTPNAFDRARAGDAHALTPAAQRGLELFSGRAQCAQCHRIEGPRARLTDDAFHSAGVGLARIAERLPELVKGVLAVSPAQVEARLSAERG